MPSHIIRIMTVILLSFGFSMTIPNIGVAAGKQDMGGWEKGGKYDRHYDVGEMDEFKGKVEKVKTIVPLPGMSPGVALEVDVGESDSVLVHICPVWFADIKKIGIRKGDKVKIKGAWAEFDGKEIFMASKIKKGEEYEFKVRLTKDGTPFWTMSPEELAREASADQ